MRAGEGTMRERELDNASLARTLSLLAERHLPYGSIAQTLGVEDEELRPSWCTACAIRYQLGLELVPPESREQLHSSMHACYNEGPVANGWYATTRRLSSLLELLQVNEALSAHYNTILRDPEGGHFMLSIAALEVAAILCPEYRLTDEARLRSVVVGAVAPRDDVERVAANAGGMLLDVDRYRDEEFTPALVERLYARLLEGVVLPDATDADELRRSVLVEALCGVVRGSCKVDDRDHSDDARSGLGDVARLASGTTAASPGHHAVIAAAIAFVLIDSACAFPTMNRLMAYVTYFLVLHRAGYHVCAHMPAVEALCAPAGGPSERDLPGRLIESGLVEKCRLRYEWTGYLEEFLDGLVSQQRYMMTKLDGMARRRERFRSILAADETMNWRQKDVLLEAILHSNAEFSYVVHEERYGVSYLCARSDFLRLLDLEFLQKQSDGIRHFFIATENIEARVIEYLRRQCPTDYALYYTPDNVLRPEFRAFEDAPTSFNRGVAFYERELVEGTYVEHQSSRREPIALSDGPRKHDKIDRLVNPQDIAREEGCVGNNDRS